MAISINWGTKEILVNKADMVLTQTIPTVIYRLDLDVLRLSLKGLEDTSDGMAFERTHKHNSPVTVGGAVLAQVIEIINGYTVTFEDDQYRVETVGANSNIGERVNVNQVSVSTSNSAGLQDLNSLQAASFGGGVTIDTTSSFAGTVFPTGTRANPVNNVEDAIAIAVKRGIFVINVASDLTITSADVSVGYTFIGNSAVTNTVTIEDAAEVSNCTFQNLTLQGVLDNGNILRECNVLDIIHNNGFIFQCALSGKITLGGGIQSTILDCYSGLAGDVNTTKIDMGGSGQPLVMRNYSGGITIMNKTGADDISLDLTSGQIIIESTVTAGTIKCRGVAKLIDRSTGTATIDHTGLITGTATVQSSGVVLVDMSTSNTGTEYPVGTTFAPVNNMADALLIATANNVEKIHFHGNGTIGATDDLTGFIVTGDHALKSTITLVSGCTTVDTQFTDCTLTGVASGNIVLRDSVSYNLSVVSGFIHQTALAGTTALANTGLTNIFDCFAGQNTVAPILDMGGSGHVASVRNYNGDLKVTNKTGFEELVMDISSGTITIDSTVTNGDIYIRGIATVIDNSTGTANVVVEALSKASVASQVWDESLLGHNSVGTAASAQKLMAYSHHIHVNVNDGAAGTTYPLGTVDSPVNNILDAITIANNIGIDKLFIDEDITIGATAVLDGFVIEGAHALKSQITVLPGASTTFTQFSNCFLTGTLSGDVVIRDSVVDDLFDFEGILHQCSLKGTIYLTGTKDVHVLDCFSAILGSGTPSVDFGGAGRSVAIRGYNGGIKLDNKTGSEPSSIDLNSGQVIVDGTVTAGLILVRGVGKVTDNSNGTTTVDQSNLVSPTSVSDATWLKDMSGIFSVGTAGNLLQKIKKIFGLIV